MERRRLTREHPALELLEEAVHLLRSAPLQFHAWYGLGTLPFLLALLFYWTDMSWSATAFRHRAESALVVALLFVWMKTCQSIYAARLRAHISRSTPEPLTLRHFAAVAVSQAILQPPKLVLLPFAVLATIPAGWAYAFFENATVLGRRRSTRELIATAWRHAGFWPRQNHFVLAIYLLVVLIVFLNVGIILIFLPQLVKMLTGVETLFSQSPGSFLNSTFIAVSTAVTYLICNPLLKSAYALRCFHSDARRSGEDLAAEVRVLRSPAPAAAVVALLFALATAAPLPAATSSPGNIPGSPSGSISPAELDRAIEQKLKQPEFSWRLPRQQETAQAEKKWPLVDAIERFFKATARATGKVIDAIGRFLQKLFGQPRLEQERSDAVGGRSTKTWMTVLTIVLVGAAIFLVAKSWRLFRQRRRPTTAAGSTPGAPDLRDESVTADLLPEDEWLAIAGEFLSKGELRLALRAYFLAGLAHLASREVITLARHKSNRDYQRELRRRASDREALLGAFWQNLQAVERVWYGDHAVDESDVRRFQQNLEEIRAC